MRAVRPAGPAEPFWPGLLAQRPEDRASQRILTGRSLTAFLSQRVPVQLPIGFIHVLSLLREPDKTAMRLFDQGCEAYEGGDYGRAVESLHGFVADQRFGRRGLPVRAAHLSSWRGSTRQSPILPRSLRE